MLLGFKKQFAPKILDGSKKFTIRNPRKREPKIGEQLYMYSALRTKKTEKITTKHTLKGIQLVDIFISRVSKIENDIPIRLKHEYTMTIKVDGRTLSDTECLCFIIYDGFGSEIAFADYWIQEIGEKKEHFEQGRKEPLMTVFTVSALDLIMYHWTDLRF